MFIMTHCFSETHGPYLSTNIESNDVRFFLSENDTNQNRIVGKMKLDEQLKYYSRMVGKNTTVILMSDHGHEAIWNRSHVFFAVCGKDYAQEHISKMTSLREFPLIMRAIFSGKKIADNLPELGHVNIEQLDLYSKKTISMYFNRKGFIPWFSIFSFGYRGVLTEDYEYIRYNLGFEILVRRGSMKYPVPPYVIDALKYDHDLLKMFRELDEKYEAVSVSSEKMRYARFFRAVIERALPRNIKKVKKLNNILSPYMANSVAIRSGGADAGDIYSGLTHENQKKIVCVIDKNPQCICHTALGLPVVSPEEVDMSKFSAIILGSRKLRTIIHEECLQYPKIVNLLDIEMILAEQGYHCGPGFWDIETLPEDWDVGFPFD